MLAATWPYLITFNSFKTILMEKSSSKWTWKLNTFCECGKRGMLTVNKKKALCFNPQSCVIDRYFISTNSYMQIAGDTCDISPQFFLNFPQNFRLRTWNQYCTQAIAWGSTILDGGSTILDGSSTIFCRFSPFFVDFHHFLSIFTIFYRFSRFTHFCRDLHFVAIYALFPQIFVGQNSLHRNITRFLHVCTNFISVLVIFVHV